MIEYKYNELKYAQRIEQSGFLTKYHVYELTLLVKLWKQQGIKPKERKEKIYEFCEKHIKGFNKVKYFKKINSALNSGGKKNNPLIIIDEVPITENEIKYINNLQLDYSCKKILFSLLVNNKIKKGICRLKYGDSSNYNFIGGKQKYYNEIYETSKISKTQKINNIINTLQALGFIDVRTRGRINLLFIDNIENSNRILFNITTFDNIGYYLDWYNGDPKIIRCENCSKLIKQTNSVRKYCKACAREINIRKTIENRKNNNFV